MASDPEQGEESIRIVQNDGNGNRIYEKDFGVSCWYAIISAHSLHMKVQIAVSLPFY